MDNKAKMAMAMEEIKAIIEKNDLAAVVVLHTPGVHSYFIKIDPTYSSARFEDGRIKIDINAKHFGFDVNKQITTLKDTSNMFRHLSIKTEEIARNLLNTSVNLDNKLGAGHSDFKESE